LPTPRRHYCARHHDAMKDVAASFLGADL